MKEKILYEKNFSKDEDEIDLIDLVFRIFRNWKLIVLLGIIGGVVGISLAMTRPKIYKAEMLMIVSKDERFSSASLDEGELSVNRKLAATYTEIAKNSVILKNIIKKYDLNITLKKLQNDVTISSVGNTELLRLTYKNSDPNLATTVANEIGNQFMLKVRNIMNFQNIKIVELAEVEKDALPQNRALIVLISLGVSVIVGCIIVSIIEIISGKLYKVKDIEKILRTSMIGSIPTLNNHLIGGEEYEK